MRKFDAETIWGISIPHSSFPLSSYPAPEEFISSPKKVANDVEIYRAFILMRQRILFWFFFSEKEFLLSWKEKKRIFSSVYMNYIHLSMFHRRWRIEQIFYELFEWKPQVSHKNEHTLKTSFYPQLDFKVGG